MSETLIKFIYDNQPTELTFKKDELLQTILNTFATKINKESTYLNFLYSGEKISLNTTKKLSELNNKDTNITISVYLKEESSNISSNTKVINAMPSPKLKESPNIICPKCKNVAEIIIDNNKITLLNCGNNHIIPDIYLNDFINTQYIDESLIKCDLCKKNKIELNEMNSKIFICKCGIYVCYDCIAKHEHHKFIDYNKKSFFCAEHGKIFNGFCKSCNKNICLVCTGDKHKTHEKILFKHIAPNEKFMNDLKASSNELTEKINKFKNDLKDLVNVFISISNNIQNDLTIYLNLIQNITKDYNRDATNYQQIKNILNISNCITKNKKNELINGMNSFLNSNDINIKLESIFEMYNKIYPENFTLYNNRMKQNEETNINKNNQYKRSNTTDNSKKSSKQNIIEIKKEKEVKKEKEIKKENKEVANRNSVNSNKEKEKEKVHTSHKNNENLNSHSNSSKELRYNNPANKNLIIIRYAINEKQPKIKLFGSKFVENNKDNFSIIINKKEMPLCEYYTYKKNDIKYDELELILAQNKKINNIKDLSYMFHTDSSNENLLSSIENFSNLNTSNVTDMSNLFHNCTLLSTIPDISKWDISNVTNINCMFYNCTSLTSLSDISKWNTSKITNVSNLFYACKKLTSLPDISNWDTSLITDMKGIFCNCVSLTSLPDISKWKTDNLTNMSGIFQQCIKLEEIPDISDWNTKNVVNMNGLFNHCDNLKKLPDISKWNTSNVNNMSYMFYFCSNLGCLPNISLWNMSKVTNMKGMFCDCSALEKLPDISKWDISSVKSMGCMFYNCISLVSLPNISEWDIKNVVDMKTMFQNCVKVPRSSIPLKFK